MTSPGNPANARSVNPRHRTPSAVIHAIQMAYLNGASPKSLRDLAPKASLRAHRRYRQWANANRIVAVSRTEGAKRQLAVSRAFKLNADHLHVRKFACIASSLGPPDLCQIVNNPSISAVKQRLALTSCYPSIARP